MTVKTIFKTLIGTIALIVCSACIIELFNVNVSGMQLKQMVKMSARQACILFTQESYKVDNGGKAGAAKMPDVIASDGTMYISGNFYGSTNPTAIWNKIYKEDERFKSFAGSEIAKYNGSPTTIKMQEVYKDLKLFVNALNSTSSGNTYDEARGKLFVQNHYTAANLGITYIDEKYTSNIFRWDLAQILSNCESASIQKDERGVPFVNYKGFNCYVSQASITNCEYEVYDLGDSGAKSKFNTRTGMDADKLGLTHTSGDNLKVTVVSINYVIPITYSGITPIKKIFNYAWRNEVAGAANSPITTSRTETLQWNDATQNMTSNTRFGADSNMPPGSLPSTGELIYTLVR